MNGRYGHTVLALIATAIVIFLINDALAGLMRGDGFSSAGYTIHLAVVAAVIIYAAYLKHQLKILGRRFDLYLDAWSKLPCGLVVRRNGRLAETSGDPALVHLSGPLDEPGEAAVDGAPVAGSEERCGPYGEAVMLYRSSVPLPDFNGGSYTVEFLFDISRSAKFIRDREEEYVQMLKVLVNMFEMKDPYSHGHSEVVSNLAQELARMLDLRQAEIDLITRAALLHDIGKIIIPSDIINKPGALTAAEIALIRTHPQVGADILANLAVFEEAAVIVRHHHERFDGQGYPAGLAGAAIPLGARIVAVADAFDAMTAGRSVYGRRSVPEALAVLNQERGRQFDPVVVTAFIDLVSTGRTGTAGRQLPAGG